MPCVQPVRPVRAPPSPPSTQRTPLRYSRNQSTYDSARSPKLQHNSPTSRHSNPQSPPQGFFGQLPIYPISAQSSHENPAIFDKACNNVVQAYHESEGLFRRARVAADIALESKPLRLTSDPVKRAPGTPYKSLSCDNLESIQASNCQVPSPAKTWETLCSQDLEIADRDILKGLQVALAAACDEQVNEYIEETTGRSIRRMLADLSLLDLLGVNELTIAARRTALKRKQGLK